MYWNMNGTLKLILTLACSLPLGSLASTLEIAEVGEQLQARLDGDLLPPPLPGQDHEEAWLVTLPDQYTFSTSALDHSPYIVGEPENPEGINRITLFPTNPGALIWESDILPNFTPADLPLTELTISGGVIGPNGPVDLVLADRLAAPDAGSTLILSGLGLCAVAALRSKLRR